VTGSEEKDNFGEATKFPYWYNRLETVLSYCFHYIFYRESLASSNSRCFIPMG